MSGCLWVVSATVSPALGGLLQKGRQLAEEKGLELRAVCISPALSEAEVAVLSQFGVHDAYHIAADCAMLDAEAAVRDCLYSLVAAERPHAVLFESSVFLGSVAPALAAMLQCGMTADCTGLQWSEDGRLLQIRPTFGGRRLATIETTGGIPFATVRRGTFAAKEQAPGTIGEPHIRELVPPATTMTWRLESMLEEKDSRDLASADIVLSGGLGLGGVENFGKLRLLAARLGAGLGASRAAVAAGLASYSHQVGQTGMSIRPAVYMAFGISGAVQHLSGIVEAGKIIAVNRDRCAPIHQYSDYSIVADCGAVLDALLQRYGESGKPRK